MSLTEHLGKPQLAVKIGDQTYQFSELPIAQRANLQAFIERVTPNPIEAIKPHLVGLDAEDRRYLLNEARKEAKDWPPCLTTQEGRRALLRTEEGQIELLAQALSVHQPEIPADGVRRIYVALEREGNLAAIQAAKEGRDYKGEGTAMRRIITCALRLASPEDEEGLPRLKAGTGERSNGSTGTHSFAGASASSE